MELHEILAMLREEKDVKQQDVADVIHVTNSAISGYEIGTSQPSYSVLVALADYYNVSTDFLLGRTNVRLSIHDINHNLQSSKRDFPLDALFKLSNENKSILAKLTNTLSDYEKLKNKY